MVASMAPKASSKDFKALARAMGPALRERAAEGETLRRLPDATIADFQEAGFFRMIQPARWGGYEVDPAIFFDTQIELARACPSSAWVMGVVAVHSWQLALFDARAQEDVWGDDSSVLISSSYAPVGKVEKVDGGFRISGRWSFSSGSDHCGWVFVGGFAPKDPNARGPDMRTFLLPRSDYVIEDTWRVSGLKATGSNDIIVDRAFVPEHRTHKLIQGFTGGSPGLIENPAPLFRLPFGQVFVRAVSSSAIGAALGALEAYRSYTAGRYATSDGSKVAEDPTAQVLCADGVATLDEVQAILRRTFEEMMVHARAGEKIPVERRVLFRYESARAVVKSMEVVDSLFTASGGRALFDGHPIQRYWQDVHAARAHYANNPDKPARNLGRVMLGMKNSDFFI
jgi:3-hydroxy-9,10-secoandrosta-1,3,5(10)-triene-9,17-dione monooxygenase